MTIGGVLSTVTTLTKAGSGTLGLSAANTYTERRRWRRGRACSTTRVWNAGITASSGAAVEISGSGLRIAEPLMG